MGKEDYFHFPSTDVNPVAPKTFILCQGKYRFNQDKKKNCFLLISIPKKMDFSDLMILFTLNPFTRYLCPAGPG